jgi:2-polyprenyl-6-hydroxyphenyl methylase/3-demethylubiquinone-9 3-methyltransferase
MNLASLPLSEREIQELEKLLAIASHQPPEVEDLWKMMDDVWNELGCNARTLEPSKIDSFYRHPVWILNGLFIEQDKQSMQSRTVIVDWINARRDEVQSLLDYGGGFGTFARLAATANRDMNIDIFEPFPNNFAIENVKPYANIQFIGSIQQQYDCLVCLDVLEHVPDPLKLFANMVEATKLDGFLIIANCFYPFIKCHLSQTFHLRYSFDFFAAQMGLEPMGLCPGSHAMLYRKVRETSLNWSKIRSLEAISKTFFVAQTFLSSLYRQIKHS